ncbi:MAG: hypothetical protein LBU50_07410 [Cellulomonas sp.]|jgi:hypothetical protein|nr:hypothetical protein [Cellulomonas sp.]
MGLVLVVDAANVVGSRPDGWWRDRAGATARLLARLAELPGRQVAGPGFAGPVGRVVVVVEGQATAVADVDGVDVVRAPRDGDTTVVEVVTRLDGLAVVVTADRGSRARLGDVPTVGPRWLWDLLDAA